MTLLAFLAGCIAGPFVLWLLIRLALWWIERPVDNTTFAKRMRGELV